MEEKGFTLIELLAVIVILAIIALIATPVVLNIIKSSKGSSIERSAELYLDQVKAEIARYNLNHPETNFNPSICEVQGNGVKCDDSDEILPVGINGNKPKDGSKIILSNGHVIGTKDFVIDSKKLTYKNGSFQEEAVKSICTAVTKATTGNIPSGSFNYGDEYTCKVGDNYTNTFFVLENNTNTVSLIMKENYTDSYVPQTLAWCTDGTGDNTTCKNITAIGSDVPSEKNYLSYIKSIFNKDEVEVSFPSANQIATASGNTFNNSVIKGLPTWLYDYLYRTTHPVSDVIGYWTSIFDADSFSAAWNIYYDGTLDKTLVSDSSEIGVRPVITIPKSEID